MNERIQALALQAGVFAGDFAGAGLYSIHNRDEVEKFAQLIVQECIQVCSNVEADTEMDLSDGALVCMAEIKEHFGVAE